MYQTNLTESFRERQLALLREAEDRRLALRLRAGFRRAIASWGRTGIPFFRA
jgi:hypothetical protein